MPRPLLRALAAALLAGALLIPTARSDAAHDRLIDSSPTTDQHLDAPPGEIRLTFSAEVMDVGAAVRVIDAADADWSAGEPELAGAVVTVPVDPSMPDGAYRAAWRVVSSDGHAISGVVPFTVGDATAGDGAAVAAAPSASAAPTSAAEPSAGSPTVPRAVWVAGAGALVAVGGYLLFLRLRRR